MNLKINNLIGSSIFFFFMVLWAFGGTSCSKKGGNVADEPVPAGRVEIYFSNPNFSLSENGTNIKMRALAIDATEPQEKQIDNLYLFLFPHAGSHYKYYITSSSFTGGSWIAAEGRIVLELSSDIVSNCDVYLVANCSDLKNSLDAVDSKEKLKTVLRTYSDLWKIGTPLLMEGEATHDFTQNRKLKSVELKRALAKLMIEVKLNKEHQSKQIKDYGYKYLNFGKKTYLLERKEPQKTGDVQSHNNWQAIEKITKDSEGNITSFRIATYINEYDNTGNANAPRAEVSFRLPFNGSGPLPPPEFGEDKYEIKLPQKVVRNTLYDYTLDISQ